MISEEELETMSHQGQTALSSNTYNKIRDIILAIPEYKGLVEVYLQGSYANDTNVFLESDVDIIVQYISNDLEISTYLLFKNRIYEILKRELGVTYVTTGNKAIRISKLGSRYVEADVITCLRGYTHSGSNECIVFYNQSGTKIINYPKQHLKNGTTKHQNTNNLFKRTVRIFKNIRRRLVDDRKITDTLAPSYFIESIIYNVPNEKFVSSNQITVLNCMKWIVDNYTNELQTQSGFHLLFGSTSTQWNRTDCLKYIQAAMEFFNR
ncbi:MAG: nucleotidyltransferase [Candidatus Woesearchaeota archaeon]|jgi:predicted nucleotidyltransferase